MDLEEDTIIEETPHEITNVKFEEFTLKYNSFNNTVQFKEEAIHIINKCFPDQKIGSDIVSKLYTSDTELFVNRIKDFCFYSETRTPDESVDMIINMYNPFESFEDQYEKEVRNLEKPVKIQEVDGIYECKKCGSTKTYYWSAQLRRSDEPPTTFINCTKCKNKWVDNG